MSFIMRPVRFTEYSPGSVVFNGTPYITRGADLTGNADGNTGLISIWVKFGTDDSSEFLWGATTDNNEIQVYRRNDNKIWVLIQDTGNNGDLFLKTGETVTVSDGWTHLLISWDVSAGYSDIYIQQHLVDWITHTVITTFLLLTLAIVVKYLMEKPLTIG
jgi:hypothetical protein